MARKAAFSMEFQSKNFEAQVRELARGYDGLPKALQNKHIKSAMRAFARQKGEGNLVSTFKRGLPKDSSGKSLWGRRQKSPGGMRRSVGVKVYLARMRKYGGPGWVMKVGCMSDAKGKGGKNPKTGWYATMVNSGTASRSRPVKSQGGTIAGGAAKLAGLGSRNLGAIQGQGFFPAIMAMMRAAGKKPLEGYMLGALKKAEKELPKYLKASKKSAWYGKKNYY